ncbi:hypothetical protein ACO0KY_11270 [Undibacterium sp. Dicai25W]|uniref:hypothetical protein n=1 Tax=Undibacterium sp. Dicai25W TaxID=3413034 RepID=UPI003BF44E11
MQVSTVQTTSLPQRLSVMSLMLLLHLMLWLAWQAQSKFKLAHEDRTSYLQILQVPSSQPIPKQESEKLTPALATSIKTANTVTKKALVSNANSARTVSEAITVAPHEAIPDVQSQQEYQQLPGVSPHLDLDALRQSAVAMEKQRRRGEIEKIQDSLKRDDSFEKQLGEGVRKAQAKDCRQAYSGLGLLAIIPLAASAISDKVCKW